jgi:hypothetical protein
LAPTLAWVLLGWGAFALSTGLARRVTTVRFDASELMVTYATGRSLRLRARDVRAVRPPRTPLSGWRLTGPIERRTLMPSDLLGHEAVLRDVVRAAGLAWNGREWRADRPQAQP